MICDIGIHDAAQFLEFVHVTHWYCAITSNGSHFTWLGSALLQFLRNKLGTLGTCITRDPQISMDAMSP